MATSLRYQLLAQVCVAWVLLVGSAQSVSAQAHGSPLRATDDGLDGLVRAAFPSTEPSVRLSAGGGYGWTEDQGEGDGGSHHRLAGNLGVAFTPLKVNWLSMAIKFEGRVDLHPDDPAVPGTSNGAVGIPTILLRAGGAINDKFQLGGDVRVSVPGEDAPSVSFDALVTDVRLLSALALGDSTWLVANVGGRLDYSYRVAPDATRLRLGHRLALGLSDSHAVLVALGLAFELTPTLHGFGEFSADMLIGGEAPPIGQSPMRVSVGARTQFGDSSVVGELAVHAAISQRPDLDLTAPLVPVEPRVYVTMGFRYGHSLLPVPTASEDGSAASEAEKSVEQPEKVEEPAAPTVATASGQLLDQNGEPLPDAFVEITQADGTTREAITDAQGRYVFTDVPMGSTEFTAKAQGFDDLVWQTDVQQADLNEEPRKLEERAPGGVLRGLTRSFSSEPLPAKIVVLEGKKKKKKQKKVLEVTADTEGHFEVPLPPGRFIVQVSAEGYRTQKRAVRIRENTVTVLNVDLRELR